MPSCADAPTHDPSTPCSPLAYAFGGPVVTGELRTSPEDFRVDEQLPFEPCGEGTHTYINIRKRNTNTDWLAQQLARFAGVKPVSVGYAGLKDRHAITSQWFSVDMARITEPDWSALNSPEIEVLAVTRHGHKLRRGVIKANHFTLVLRNLRGDKNTLAQRLNAMRSTGVPNYFGEQRFGRDGANLVQARRLFAGEIRVKDRHKRGLYLSAARSFLFNEVLSTRVARGDWATGLNGDVMMLDGSRNYFQSPLIDETIAQRLLEMDIHPGGPLWGRGSPLATDAALLVEHDALAPYAEIRAGLEQAGMKQERRAMRLRTDSLAWEYIDDNAVSLSFQLPTGTYATSVLRELADYTTSPAAQHPRP